MIQGWIDPSFHALCTKFWPYLVSVAAEFKTKPGNIFLVFNCLNLVSPCKLSSQFPVLSWQEWHPPAVVLLLQMCAFRDALVHTSLITHGYLSYCCLSINFHHYSYSLTWYQPCIFAQRNAAYWIFSDHSANSRDGCAWKYQYIYSFLNTQISISGTNNHVQIHLNYLSSSLWCSFDIQ